MKTEEKEKYSEDHSGQESSLLKKIQRETHAKVLKPRMLSGHMQGRILSLLSHLVKPTYILEIGTYTAYSAICLAEGLAPGGKLISIEANPELEVHIKKNISESAYNDKIQLILGNALDVIPTLNLTFDMVFIDADKLNYKAYYENVFPLVKIGGLIISDNVLWDNKVLDDTIKDKTTVYLREYNQFLSQDNRTEKVLLPIRDGLYISRKISH